MKLPEIGMTAFQAAWLVVLLEPGRRRNTQPLPAEVLELLTELDELSGRAAVPKMDGPTMRVAEAAELLDVSPRRVTALLAERKLLGSKQGGRWVIDASDVILRMGSEPLGTPSESDSEPACA